MISRKINIWQVYKNDKTMYKICSWSILIVLFVLLKILYRSDISQRPVILLYIVSFVDAYCFLICALCVCVCIQFGSVIVLSVAYIWSLQCGYPVDSWDSSIYSLYPRVTILTVQNPLPPVALVIRCFCNLRKWLNTR